MSSTDALYRVHDDAVRIPVGRREVSRVAVSASHVTLELMSLKDPLTSTVDLYTIDSIDVGQAGHSRYPALGGEEPTLSGLLGRRVTSCVGSPDGNLELRATGSSSLRSSSWTVAYGDGRHWAPHVDGRVAEWRPGNWLVGSVRPHRRTVWHEQQLASTVPIPVVGQRLQSISFVDQGLGLLFGLDPEIQPNRRIERSPEIEIELKGSLALAPGRQPIKADTPSSVAPLLALVDVATTGGDARPDGRLEGFEFADGSVLTAGPGDGNQWAVTIADQGGWFLGEDGSTRTSKPKEVLPLGDAGRGTLVRAYLEYSATDRPDLFWASERLRNLTAQAPDDAYEVIRELVRQAPSPYVLSIVAAAPLEDLLSDWGERFIDRLEADARDDPKLMAACAGVWRLWMPDDVWDRLRRLVTDDMTA